MKKWLLLGSLVLLLAGLSVAALTPEELLSAGRVDEAIRLLRQRTAGSANDAEAWHLLSRSYYAKGQWDSAIDAAQRAVALKPNSSDYHLWLGRAYGQKADNVSWFSAISLAGKTRSEFEKAVALDGNNVGARADLAEFYTEAPGIVGGGKDKARQQAELLVAKDAATAHLIKARLAEKEKDLGTAEREYRAAVEASKGNGGRWLDLAAFYKRAGRAKEMQHAMDQAVAAEKKSGEVFYEAAAILVDSDLQRAAKLVRQYLSLDKKVEEAPAFRAHFLLGNILEKQGQKQEAVAEYRAALDLNSDFAEARNALNRLSRP